MRGSFKKATVVAIASLTVLGLSTAQSVAGAKAKPKAGTPQILIRCSPNPLVETSTSDIVTVCQVEANPAFAANKTITISSTQLVNHCKGPNFLLAAFGDGQTGTVAFLTISGLEANGVDPARPEDPGVFGNTITVTADNDGNATVLVTGTSCAPGTALIEASLNAPPFSTATTKLVVQPPQVTPPGLHAFPNPEVETGDGGAGQGTYGASTAYFVFYVETNPVFAEQNVSITSNELTARCGLGFDLASTDFLNGVFPTNPGGVTSDFEETDIGVPTPPTTGRVVYGTIDNDGNAVFGFVGSSCAAGKSTVIAEVLNNGATYSTQVSILPPAVTI
jgi:hypothetical protein